MKTVILGLLSLFVIRAEALVVTSLNIEWFGRGGSIYGSIEDEYRQERLKDYISNQLPDSDVFVFQEITHVESISEIMKAYECISYDAGTSRHQFVVMCSKPGLLQAQKVNHDVRLGKKGLRAALIGEYKVLETTYKVIGVHLKAGKAETELRLEQVDALQKDLKDEKPTIIVGDFNTYRKERTNLSFDDTEYINESLGLKFKLVANETPTYMGYYSRVFDRAWTKNVKGAAASVYGPCSENSVAAPFDARNFYNRFISDHCALTIEAK